MSKLKSGLLVLGFYLVFLLMLVPAAWWLKLVTLPAGVRVGPVSGTLWQGEVQAVSVEGIVLPSVRWQLRPLALLGGVLQLQLNAGQQQQQQWPYLTSELKFGFSGVELTQTQLRVAASQLQPVLQLPLPVGLDGQVHLKVQQLLWNETGCQQLSGLVSWMNARIQPPTGWIGLGTLDGRLSCEQQQIQLVTTASPPLNLAVTATVSPAGQYQLQGYIKPDQSMPEEVHQAMRFVGKPDEQGRFPLQLASH